MTKAKSALHASFLIAAKAGVSLALLALAFWGLDLQAITQAVGNLSVASAILVVLLLLIEFPILGGRWIVLMAGQNISTYRLMRGYFIAAFFSAFTPAQIGADAARYFDLKKTGVSGSFLVGVMMRERVMGLASFIYFFLFCMIVVMIQGLVIPAAVSQIALGVVPIMIGAGILAAFGHLLLPLVIARANRWGGGWTARLNVAATALLTKLPNNKWWSAWFFSVVGGCLLWTAAVWLVNRDIGPDIPFAVIGMIAVLVELVRLVPITIQGIGVREAAYAYCFQIMGHAPENGFVVGAVAYALASLAVILIGVIGYILPRR